ncbi:hypothetical protein [Amycolatopsis sp. lyj-23]|uniref:hypothetical protein n=1 Tax=Amycolatopsis sp. lyj-23 TaxID=2789283 RepID=UPI0039788091
MPDRIEISRHSKPLPCGRCGQHTLHVGRILSPAGLLLGRTMVCTACRPQHHAEAVRRVA